MDIRNTTLADTKAITHLYLHSFDNVEHQEVATLATAFSEKIDIQTIVPLCNQSSGNPASPNYLHT